MTEQLRESLSAMMDDEVADFELRRTLKQLGEGEELRQTWRRYHLASAAMKRNLDKHFQIDVSQGVAAAIAELDVEVTATGASHRGRQWFASLAVAASVAFVVVFGVTQIQQQDASNPAVVSNSPAPEASDYTQPVIAAQTVSSEGDARAEARLKELMEHHTLQADMARVSGVMPYSQLVGRDNER